eukprot:CAMPEP_0175061424 /NCGR_PEP_ID=MMETSP0052_2-20121109/13577_1 /TAXON_ID=51329 ORGANISM="Polytomella parva, Strain SAG 63-3" /NCGR_SAMPLE_ID=MMETSP0052_2 /ASSEMBLY_ACC=CAM_ASM_000194 /LENGTH=263 /DNA_ID=CAMNT_0016327277 /DNA_START=231 /DNA_END=1025 /DNA_ORIENTATION=+
MEYQVAEASVEEEEMAVTDTAAEDTKPGCWLITHSVSKRHNVGTLLRCATAFGVRQVCLVGSRQFNAFGSHGSDVYVDLRHFDNLRNCCAALKEEHGCQIVGIEITPEAKPVQSHPFTGPTAFMLGNEGQGLSKAQLALCDSFVYIPQYGTGTASLNVAVAASIVLHQFAVWAQYDEHAREGQKFVVGPRPVRRGPRGAVRGEGDGNGDDEVRAARETRRAEGRSEEAEGLGQQLAMALFEDELIAERDGEEIKEDLEEVRAL